MSNTTERFIRAFEDIRLIVNDRAGCASSGGFKIDAAAQRDSGVKRNRDLLRYIREIRNALQHPKHRAAGYAMTVTPAFLTEVESLLKYLQNPPTATTLGVARKEMMIAQLNEPLGKLADAMKEEGFSHLPILDDEGVLIGVFNEAAVFDYLWCDEEQIVGRSMTVQDILAHCRLDASHTETFRFVAPGTPVAELIDLFRAVESPMTRVGAVFVTLNGKENQVVHRLITPWDVFSETVG